MKVSCPKIGKQSPFTQHTSMNIPFRSTCRNEYVVTGYYVREYVKGFMNAKKRACYIALKTQRWGKVETVRIRNKYVGKTQRFISMYTDNGLDCDNAVI